MKFCSLLYQFYAMHKVFVKVTSITFCKSLKCKFSLFKQEFRVFFFFEFTEHIPPFTIRKLLSILLKYKLGTFILAKQVLT